MKLNKTAVDKLESPDKNPAFVWDDALPGFGVRVTKSGAKAFIVQTRVNGKSRRATIGRFGTFTVDQARKLARAELGRMAQGVDPSETKQKDAADREKSKALRVTLDQVFTEYRQSRRKDGKARKQSTIDDIEGHLARNFADWRGRPVTGITRDGVLKRHQKITERGQYQADQAMRYLRSLLNFARDLHTAPDGEPILPSNPVDILRSARQWHAPERRRNVIPRAQLGDAVATIEAIAHAPDSSRTQATAADLVLFLLFTGLRVGEASALEWDDVDTDAATIALDDPKNRKPTTLPLSTEAQAIINRRARARADDYVFPGRSGGYLRDTRGIRRRVDSSLTNHDLRRTFASIATEQGVNHYTLKRLLNHAVSAADVTGGYISTDTEAQRQAADSVGQFIRSQTQAATRDNVVAIGAQA